LGGTRKRTFGVFAPAHKIKFFSEAFCAAFSLALVIQSAARFAPWGPIPTANCINIDAFSPETVTRKTLIRYKVKSQHVNALLVGFL
jgi:hypothetical protein